MILQPREFLAGKKGRFVVENLEAERQARHFHPNAIIKKRKKDR